MSTGAATVSFAAGLAPAVVVEVVVCVRGYLGVHPSNVAGPVALVWAVSALVGEMPGMGVIAMIVWLAGIAARPRVGIPVIAFPMVRHRAGGSLCGHRDCVVESRELE